MSFEEAQRALHDPSRLIVLDVKHSQWETRFFCHGRVHGVVLTIRFTLSGDVVRIFGAARWRKGEWEYENR